MRTSFATGSNPGKHGIYDFVTRDENGYALKVVTTRHLGDPALGAAQQAGKRVAVINVSMTYPASQMNGIMITGLGTPDRRPFAYPPELSAQLTASEYGSNKWSSMNRDAKTPSCATCIRSQTRSQILHRSCAT